MARKDELHYVSLDASFNSWELTINGGAMSEKLVSVEGIHWGLALRHNLAAFYISICSAEPNCLPVDSRSCRIVDCNYSMIVKSRNASTENPYNDAYMNPAILKGVVGIEALTFRICDFDQLNNYVDGNGLIHVECWLAFRKAFFACEAPIKTTKANA